MVRHSGSEKADDALFALLGEVIVRWNDCEAKFRLLVYKLCGGTGDGVDILSNALSNVALSDVMVAASPLADKTVGDHLRHAAAVFTAVRKHRNYLVHGPILTSLEGDVPKFFVQEIAVRNGEFTIHQSGIGESEYRLVLLHLHDLSEYLGNLMGVLWGNPHSPPVSSLEKPRLPKPLRRSSHDLLELRSRHESSRE